MNNSQPRVVLDTNVLLSALIFGGKPRQLIEMFARSEVTVVISEEIFTEMRRKVSQKFPDFIDDAVTMELLLEQDAKMVKLGSLTITICRDADDNRILETAILGKCQYIVTGDKDLLTLKAYKSVQIVNPAEFLETCANKK